MYITRLNYTAQSSKRRTEKACNCPSVTYSKQHGERLITFSSCQYCYKRTIETERFQKAEGRPDNMPLAERKEAERRSIRTQTRGK